MKKTLYIILIILLFISCKKENKKILNNNLSKYIESGDLKKVKYYIKLGADVNARDINNITPLMDASYYGHKEIVEYLISKKAKLNLTEEHGWTA